MFVLQTVTWDVFVVASLVFVLYEASCRWNHGSNTLLDSWKRGINQLWVTLLWVSSIVSFGWDLVTKVLGQPLPIEILDDGANWWTGECASFFEYYRSCATEWWIRWILDFLLFDGLKPWAAWPNWLNVPPAQGARPADDFAWDSGASGAKMW